MRNRERLPFEVVRRRDRFGRDHDVPVLVPERDRGDSDPVLSRQHRHFDQDRRAVDAPRIQRVHKFGPRAVFDEFDL